MEQNNEANFKDKKHFLYLKQKAMLDTFLAKGAITQAEYDKSLRTLAEKMGKTERAPSLS